MLKNRSRNRLHGQEAFYDKKTEHFVYLRRNTHQNDCRQILEELLCRVLSKVVLHATVDCVAMSSLRNIHTALLRVGTPSASV